MKFIIYNDAVIPGYNGIRGPIMTPRKYNLHEVLNWIACGVDVREVMPDGSYRRLEFNDKKLNEMIDKEDCECKEKEEKVVETPKKKEVVKKVQPKKNEIKKEEVKEEKPVVVEEPKLELPLDTLEKLDD